MVIETYAVARERLLRELKGKGWKTSKPDLKVSWAAPPSRAYKRWFKPREVHRNDHSLFVEMRGLSAEDLISFAEHWWGSSK